MSQNRTYKNQTWVVKTLGGIVIPDETPTSAAGRTMTSGGTGTDSAYLATKKATTGDSVTAFISGMTYTSISQDDWFTIGLIPTGDTPGSGTELTGPIGDFTNYQWANYFYEGAGDLRAFLFQWGGAGSWDVTLYTYTGSTVNSYDNIMVSAIRSRGRYVVSDLVMQTTGVTMSSATDDITGNPTIEENPLGDFTLTVASTATADLKSFTCSLDSTSTKFIDKVLGVEVFDKTYTDYPAYAFETYDELVAALNARGLIRGLSATELEHSVGDDFLTQWDSPISPMIVSEVRGGKVDDLFQVYSISDGDAANAQVKIQILNINLETAEFDLIVRDFNDTDDNPVTLEKFSRCSMNPELPGYVALKVGTSDTTYELRSKYIMLSMVEDHPTDAVPAGFKGFTADTLDSAYLGNVMYKTSYYTAGDEVTYTAGVPDDIATDRVRRVSLGLSSQMGFDKSLFGYKGTAANFTSTGFHLSSNASSITGGTITGYMFDCTPYDLEGTSKGMLDVVANRKFTFAVNGGFDGWDIYRSVRTYGDAYIYGKSTYTNCNDTNGGVFNDDVGNSDYYAFLAGIEEYANPEAVDINVFATPGINWYDQSSLVDQAIDMTETDRADSLYVIGAPNRDTVAEVVGDMETIGLDTNYSCTYFPWIQIRDNDNSTQIFVPPTGEVVRNIALTDNVAYPWFASAGYSRGLVQAVKAFKKLTLDERDELYKTRINPIATYSDTGPIIWGNKTLQIKESALDRINVRRLLLRTRKLVSAVAVRLLFEQNDEEVRNEFTRLVNPILEAIKKERGLYDFRMSVSNDPEDLDQNTLRGKIYIKPTRSLEYIDVEFIITPTGASFENV